LKANVLHELRPNSKVGQGTWFRHANLVYPWVRHDALFLGYFLSKCRQFRSWHWIVLKDYFVSPELNMYKRNFKLSTDFSKHFVHWYIMSRPDLRRNLSTTLDKLKNHNWEINRDL
jgi:hypothetical protein